MQKFDALLVGFYGMQNTGDDMLMAAAAAGAKRVFSAINMAATAPLGSDSPALMGLNCIQSRQQHYKGQDRLLKYRAAWRSRHIVIGGGSVLHTRKDIDQKRHYLTLAATNRHIAAGVGIGPFVDRGAEKACAEFLNRCAFTGVRDRDSLEIARSIAPSANVALTFDLAPGLRFEQAFENALAPQRENAIGIALCPAERFHGDLAAEARRMRAIAGAVRRYAQESGCEVRLIDFNGHSHLGDHQVHTELLAGLEGVPARIISYHANPYKAITEISRLQSIIAMRLHAAVFAYLSETPCVALNYHPKCHNWCRDIGHHVNFSCDSGDVDSEWLLARLTDIAAGAYIPASLALSSAAAKANENWSMTL